MNLETRFEAIFEDYEYRNESMLLDSARFACDRLYDSLEAYEPGKGRKFIALFCAITCAIDGIPNKQEYDFFQKTTGLSFSYDDFKKFGISEKNNDKVKMEIRNLGKKYHNSSIDYGFNILGLSLCACDGKFTESEKDYCKEYIPHPGILD